MTINPTYMNHQIIRQLFLITRSSYLPGCRYCRLFRMRAAAEVAQILRSDVGITIPDKLPAHDSCQLIFQVLASQRWWNRPRVVPLAVCTGGVVLKLVTSGTIERHEPRVASPTAQLRNTDVVELPVELVARILEVRDKGALTVDYALVWILGNVISDETMYCRSCLSVD